MAFFDVPSTTATKVINILLIAIFNSDYSPDLRFAGSPSLRLRRKEGIKKAIN
jgi:hypothetical protein